MQDLREEAQHLGHGMPCAKAVPFSTGYPVVGIVGGQEHFPVQAELRIFPAVQLKHAQGKGKPYCQGNAEDAPENVRHNPAHPDAGLCGLYGLCSLCRFFHHSGMPSFLATKKERFPSPLL